MGVTARLLVTASLATSLGVGGCPGRSDGGAPPTPGSVSVAPGAPGALGARAAGGPVAEADRLGVGVGPGDPDLADPPPGFDGDAGAVPPTLGSDSGVEL